LPTPNGAVARFLDSGARAIRGFVSEQIGEPLIDVIDVEGGDFHFSPASVLSVMHHFPYAQPISIM
jgi:hypothetical protein